MIYSPINNWDRSYPADKYIYVIIIRNDDDLHNVHILTRIYSSIKNWDCSYPADKYDCDDDLHILRMI